MLKVPTVLAFDFDGVICDGLKEYFQTAWQAYCEIWQPATVTPPDALAEQFYRLRPVVESGWEMPLVLRSLLLGTAETDILNGWSAIAAELVQSENLQPKVLGTTVDGIRDRLIATDLDTWLADHLFYPGVIDKLRELDDNPTHPVIISTKEGRFIRQLLEREGIHLSDRQIYGKETGCPKHQVLRELINQYVETATFWFIEDRLKTLHTIQAQSDLGKVKLFLADWGYNTAEERSRAQADPTIQLVSLPQFPDFASWLVE